MLVFILNYHTLWRSQGWKTPYIQEHSNFANNNKIYRKPIGINLAYTKQLAVCYTNHDINEYIPAYRATALGAALWFIELHKIFWFCMFFPFDLGYINYLCQSIIINVHDTFVKLNVCLDYLIVWLKWLPFNNIQWYERNISVFNLRYHFSFKLGGKNKRRDLSFKS